MENFDIIIVGGGSGGILCALECAKNGLSVCILEANSRIGKKLMASGNGRGNISNVNLNVSNYNNDFVTNTLSEFPSQKIVDYFADLGVLVREEDGRIYPYSESVGSLLNVFLDALDKYKVEIRCDKKVVSIEKKNEIFYVDCVGDKFCAKNVVLACGSRASFGLESYHLATMFGHKVTEMIPCVGGLVSDSVVGANGVRAKVEAKLELNGQSCRVEKGELLFKDGIISGVLVFVLSSFIARAWRNDKKLSAKLIIDFVPDMEQADLEHFLLKNENFTHCLDGIFHKAIAINIFRNTIMDRSALMTPFKAKNIAQTCKNFVANLSGLAEVKNCQVMCGGLDTAQWDSKNMQSLLINKLFAIGEMLDVDGECGGYNLHWAWSSALVCAKEIIKCSK